MHIKRFKYGYVCLAALLFMGGSPTRFGRENTFFHGFAIPNPVIRIGLGTNLREVGIKSSSGMKIYEVSSGYKSLGEDVAEARIRGDGDKLSEKFVLLAAQSNEKKEAEKIAAELQKKCGGRVEIDEEYESGQNAVFQVKIGDFMTRSSALAFAEKLKMFDVKDVWILREDIVTNETGPRWILVDDRLIPLTRDSVLYFVPSRPGSCLSYNGRRYRGIFLLKDSPKGIVLINVLNMEEYLKGVVPGEMSPDVYDQQEALKAQAVAARTYAIKNAGQYGSLGFDLINTPASQVYGGMDSEKPLSTEAVEETSGEVLLYGRELINALYTSTCGGMTENVENVFAGNPSPYLKSTECSSEKQPEWTLEGGAALSSCMVGGIDITPEIAVLVSLGILPESFDGKTLDQPCSAEEFITWARLALKSAGKLQVPDLAVVPSPRIDFLSLSRMIVEAYGWKTHVENLLLSSEVEFLLRDIADAQGKNRKDLAYCLQMGLFPGLNAGIKEAGRQVTKAELALALFKIMDRYDSQWHEGSIVKRNAESLELKENGTTVSRKLSPKMFLMRKIEGPSGFASQLSVLGDEKVRWIERDGEIRWLEVKIFSGSNSLDRSSRYNRWIVRKTTEEIETSINAHNPIGRLVDIRVERRGASKRAAVIRIIGTEKQIVIQGFRIRSVMGVRDTLFDIDRERDNSGRVSRFIFTGRGWGHGVGLCQVGAYGMARIGAGYKDILKKYYHGVRIEKMY